MSIKKPSKKQMTVVGIVVLVVVLIASGVAGTLTYQKFISDTKAQGVTEFKANDCDKYAKDGMTWLECDL